MIKKLAIQNGCVQTGNDESFIGGHPKIPQRSVPICQLCNHELTFFFQITFPDCHPWANYSVALFSCVHCFSRKYVIPEYTGPGPVPNAVLSGSFLESYQKNFKFLVFRNEDSSILDGYNPNVEFKKFEFVNCGENENVHKLGGKPNWILRDEAPKSIDGVEAIFLFQILQDDAMFTNPKFVRLPEAPLQPSSLGLLPRNYYRLFANNSLYFFGPKIPKDPLIYVVVQS